MFLRADAQRDKNGKINAFLQIFFTKETKPEPLRTAYIDVYIFVCGA
jgi:hypothetical protein